MQHPPAAVGPARHQAPPFACGKLAQGKLAADLSFYSDGFPVLARDLVRDAPLVLVPPGALPAGMLARRRRAQADMLSLLPFAFIIVNTFPMTTALLPPLMERVPRRWLLPSAFEEARRKAMRRLRRHRGRAAAQAAALRRRRRAETASSERKAAGGGKG